MPLKPAFHKKLFKRYLTDDQKEKIAFGALKMMTNKDGFLMANFVNPKTKKIVLTILLDKVKFINDQTESM